MTRVTATGRRYLPEAGVVPVGRYTAWATADGMHAVVKCGSHIVRRLEGETAHTDAVRIAGDLNVLDKR